MVCIAYQQAEQTVFRTGQIQGSAVQIGPASQKVNSGVTALDHLRRHWLGHTGPAQQCPDAGTQLAQFERFGHVVVTAAVQAADDADFFVRRCQENNGDQPILRPDPFADFKPRSVRQSDIQKQQNILAEVGQQRKRLSDRPDNI